MAYGKTREEALAAVEALAPRVIADRIENYTTREYSGDRSGGNFAAGSV